jgi:flagellar hook-associated protein 3 FlgL
MRVTQGMEQAQFLATINQLESSIASNQNDISSGLSFTTASEDPVGAGLVSGYNQVLAQSQQYTSNGNSAQSSLNIEDNAITQLQNQLQSVRSLALEANNGTESQQDLSAIATQVSQIQQSLLSLANTQDGAGNYIFGGFATATQPFSLSPSGATYSGDQGQRQVQIGAAQTVVVGDNGDLVFNQIKNGNGTVNVTAAAGNTGTGILGATTVSNPTAYTGGSYTIEFTAPNAYKVVSSTGATVTSGAYASGQAISFAGLEVTLSGQPAAADNFDVAPSSNQSLFATVENLATALGQGNTSPAAQAQLNNSIAGAVNGIDQALQHLQTVQSSVGARLNSITAQQSVATTQQTQLQQSITSIQGLDYASAITTLDSQNTTLSAAMQAFTQTQGLSLFKYLQGG